MLGAKSQSAAEIYIQKYDSLAIGLMNEFGIPASLILGIALQESAAGTSKLCLNKHNHFGTKTRVRSSKTKSGYATVYRRFDSDTASYRFFAEMLASRKYYQNLRCNMDYTKWLKALKTARYATSKYWIPRVAALITHHELTRYDPKPALPEIQPAQADTI